ncbi:uncharacterized protein LOC119081083 [Bradysia coprophila]|uniref:uncharacterized protein LOC119081083 n=1 Tax=Bradysia coprophila TaxID=38358 RepID=UPI00187DC14C|nr:uncharacterized protein LOC119081083 [Bradysia coprophila]
MSGLDSKLIDEFKLVPALYDRTHAKFKDKAFVENAWNNIAEQLCYDVNILKDRMYQLRNRYNVEKRRLQSLRDDGLPNPKPMWPLYHNLNFLSSHIRQRKSYKTMRMRTVTVEAGFRGFTKAEGCRFVRPYATDRTVEIKNEVGDQLNLNGDADESMDTSRISQTLRNIDRLKQSLLADNDFSGIVSPEKILKNHHPSQKFEAFGSFVSDSLQDLPENNALEIIARFTSEIVQAIIEHGLESSNC